MRQGIRYFRTVAESLLTLSKHGVRAAYHQYRERRALQHHRRADIQPHLAARLNLLAAREESPLHTAFQLAGCTDVRKLTQEAVERGQSELVERLQLVSLKDLLALYTYVRYFGDLRVANFLRNQTLLAYLREQERSQHVMPLALAAALERGDAQWVLSTVRSKIARDAENVDIDEVTAMAHALQGKIPEAVQLWRRSFGPHDRSFQDTIAGKTIAVVGPAPPIDDVREEIDSFDLVVRPNFHGNANLQQGSRTDISYYNGTRLASRRKEIVESASQLKWLITSRASDETLKHLLPNHPGIRPAENALSLFLHANPLGVPTILSDLIRFGPARIKLFCTNFFASRSLYTKEYQDASVGAAAISHSLRIHDPFSSFSLVQNLTKAGLCEVDAVAAEVLNLTREEYAANLQRMYGSYTVANEKPL
jgi:hypothetical protein